jgi:hypothetical protein
MENFMDSNIKIVFLDIDGVLNSRSSIVAFGDHDEFDPVACGLLRVLLKNTGACIVIVSKRRCGKTVDQLRDMMTRLAGKKIGRRVIGKLADSTSIPRGELVSAWLNAEQFDGPGVIIDDKADYLPQQLPFFVQPDAQVGFRLADFDRACTILMGQAAA